MASDDVYTWKGLDAPFRMGVNSQGEVCTHLEDSLYVLRHIAVLLRDGVGTPEGVFLAEALLRDTDRLDAAAMELVNQWHEQRDGGHGND